MRIGAAESALTKALDMGGLDDEADSGCCSALRHAAENLTPPLKPSARPVMMMMSQKMRFVDPFYRTPLVGKPSRLG